MGVCLVGVDGRDGGILLHGNRIGKIGWAPSTALYPEHGQPRSARTSAQKWILFADSERIWYFPRNYYWTKCNQNLQKTL
ncbi:unnamed protein product [Acanthoscelides obtectus]|uniref:Uncharacterized protein n=1 Tax=Acanthoscelides obtectus TaxID=200917 RepID=A0A9P0KCE6_ACAOB|nr:unnamed protein product [Acanthoscelides obtectus]CAK1677239.1 hypothetical protein AOBTE_LOCUS31199 [Acanthoscelides obtectus]